MNKEILKQDFKNGFEEVKNKTNKVKDQAFWLQDLIWDYHGSGYEEICEKSDQLIDEVLSLTDSVKDLDLLKSLLEVK